MSANKTVLAETQVNTPVVETPVAKPKAKRGPKPKAQIPKIELTTQTLVPINIEPVEQSSACVAETSVNNEHSETKELNLKLTSIDIADVEPQIITPRAEINDDESDSDDELFESIKNKSAAVENTVVDYTPLDLFDYVLKSYPQLDKLEVYVKHPGDTGAFDKYYCPVIFMKAINSDNSTKMLKYEKFSKDVFSVIIPKQFVENCSFEQAFCVVIYKQIKTYKSTGKTYRRIQISTDDFEDIINKYITKYNISTIKPSKLNKDDMAELGLE
jgi:hypothetical protein